MRQIKRSEDVELVPYWQTNHSVAASSSTRQPSEDVEEVPYMPPMLKDAEKVHNTADDETPYMDSLPSTPRAGSAERELMTPSSGVATGASAVEHPPEAAGQPESAAAQLAGATAEQPPGHEESNQRGGGPQQI